MAKNMILHDTRLIGNAPSSLANNIFKIDGNFDTAQAFQWIGTYARSQKGLDHLLIMCHGGVKEDSEMPNQNLKSMALRERGLQIGKQNLLHSNLHVTAVLKGFVTKITVFACNIAETDSGVKNTADDGKLFCKYLAAYTDAEVIASSETQLYHRGVMSALFGVTGTIDFGQWEGPVYSFMPDGKMKLIK